MINGNILKVKSMKSSLRKCKWINVALLSFNVSMLMADQASTYKQKYLLTIMQNVTPDIVSDYRRKGKADSEIKKIIFNVGKGLTDCQMKLLSQYDERYVTTIYSVVASGGSIDESNKIVEQKMHKDISSGKVKKHEVAAQIHNAIMLMTQCSAKVLKNLP